MSVRGRVLLGVLAACGGNSSGDQPGPDGGVASDARATTDAGVVLDGAPPTDAAMATVTRVGGVIALEERAAFCTTLAACGALDYEDCRAAADDTTTVQFAIPGCVSDARLEAAVSCVKANPSCSATTCDAVVEAWATAFASTTCESDVYSVGIGDRFPIGASDSTCDGGVRASGGWCTRACSTPQQCAGTGTNGNNHFGTANTCGDDSLLGGHGCYPTCTSTRECQAWFGETRYGQRIACKQFEPSVAPSPICVRVNDNRGVELP